VDAAKRQALDAVFSRRNGKHWPAVAQAIDEAVQSVALRGFCSASWQPEVVALSTPLCTQEEVYVLNVSVSTKDSLATVEAALADQLLRLRDQVVNAIRHEHA
jgi:hypothetical protein